MPQLSILSPLFTDLYELTMGAAYFENQVFSRATFSVFVRECPAQRGYFVWAGLENVLRQLKNLRFSHDDQTYLRSTGLFSESYARYLENFKFTGDVHALPEGSLFFPGEPILEITAPVIEAQMVETLVLNTAGFPILAATKAARCKVAAQGRQLIDFSLRRTQGADAGMEVARSSYIIGFSSTSNVLAGKRYGVPISGTMAHSFIMAFEDETSAFRAYSRIFPGHSVFLIDTYDTLTGAENAARVAKEMEKSGHYLKGVRLDSGDMVELSIRVRKILDDAGLSYVKIIASSGFDEYKIDDALRRGAKIDAFGIGTKLGVSADAPYLDIVYKMVRYGEKNVRKLSPGKKTLAGEKQIFRKYDQNGRMEWDTVGTRQETIRGTEPLLEKVMENGAYVKPLPSLEGIRTRFEESFSRLPEKYKALNPGDAFPVKISSALENLTP